MDSELVGLINIIGGVFVILGSVGLFHESGLGYANIKHDLFGISMIVIGCLIVTLNTLVTAFS